MEAFTAAAAACMAAAVDEAVEEEGLIQPPHAATSSMSMMDTAKMDTVNKTDMGMMATIKEEEEEVKEHEGTKHSTIPSSMMPQIDQHFATTRLTMVELVGILSNPSLSRL